MDSNIMESGVNDILLSGYYGFGNVGDEAILEASLQAFHDKGLKTGVLSHSPLETKQKFNVEVYGRTRLLDILEAIQSSRLVLSGGGGLFQDTTSFRSLAYYLRIPFLAKLLGKKTMVFAQGIGPIQTRKGKILTRLVLNWLVHRITVRDQSSKELLESLGVKKEIEVTADLAFLLSSPSEEEIKEVQSRFLIPVNSFGVVLRRWPNLETKIPALSTALSTFSKKYNLTPVLVSFQAGSDNQIFKALQEKMTVPHFLLMEPIPVRTLLAIFKNFEFVCGMRFHSLVFATLCQTPFIAFSYDEKVKSLATLLRLPLLELEELETEKLLITLDRLWDQRRRFSDQMRDVLPTLQEKAKRNITLALELLKNGKSKSLHEEY